MRVTRGFTVAELLVAAAIAGMATALMMMTIVRQQRFFSSAGEILGVRAQLRDAADVLVSDIRSASVAESGLPSMTDTSIELYSVIASSVVCLSPSATTLGLPPSKLLSGSSLTAMLVLPDTGDIAAIYNADSAAWATYRISGFVTRSIAASCPSTTGFTTIGDAAAGYLLTLSTAPTSPIKSGSIVHFVRRARYSFYRSSDGEWYLGYRRCSVAPLGACSSIQPVSGPYRPYGSAGGGGISFRYRDRFGVEITTAAQSRALARIDIVLRGEAPSLISLTGDARKVWRDSVAVSVSPRNRAQ